MSRRSMLKALIGAALILPAAPVHAHARLVKSEPARRAVLKRAPQRVRLWFNERLEPAFSSLEIKNANGQSVAAGAARVSEDDNKLLERDLQPLPSGRYTVEYAVLSVDGHRVSSSYLFRIEQQ